MRRHDANEFRSRLEKKWPVDSEALERLAHTVCECYALPHTRGLSISDVECEEMVLKCVQYLANVGRQCDLLTSDDHRLLIIARTADDRLETGNSSM
jgi:hypothetical protein